jgi:hypothetical protein
MGQFETKWLSRPENLAALADLPGQWIDKVHQRRPPRIVVLDSQAGAVSRFDKTATMIGMPISVHTSWSGVHRRAFRLALLRG